MAEDTENNKDIKLDLSFERIVPWNGQQDTGRDVRLKLDRNWQKVVDAFQTVMKYVVTGGNMDDRYLRKNEEDVAQELITFLKGLVSNQVRSDGFSPGELGSGFTLHQDETGSYLEIDYLLVRRIAYFIELVIKSLKHIGGTLVLSPASMLCSKVEEYDAYYRCYFEHERDGRTIHQEFVPGDQARAQEFNVKEGVNPNVSNRFYWRLVIAVGENYIDLSKSDAAVGSVAPQAGDDIVLLGNRDDVTRQNAIILSTIGDDAPSIKQYKGIDSYSTVGKEVTILSAVLNLFTGRFKSTVTGKDFDEVLDEFGSDLSKIKAQTDQVYTIWFYEYEPTLENIPACEWSDQDKIDHEYDLFYYSEAGLAWRFVSGQWQPITDQQTLAALEKAKKAQDTADGKRRNFVSQPVPPYDEGDTWSNATYGTLYTNDNLVCIRSKAEGEQFSIDDWQPTSDMNSSTKKTFESLIEQLDDRITLQVTNHENLGSTVTSLGIRIDGAEDTLTIYGTRIGDLEGDVTDLGLRLNTAEGTISLYAERFTDNESSISALQVDLQSVSSLVVAAQGSADDAYDLAETAKAQAVTATLMGMYSGEEYNQTRNPWLDWASGEEYKHVGAIWYNPDTEVTKRYVGTDNSNSWETAEDSLYASATFVYQNQNKWAAIATNFDSDGNPKSTSGIVTTATFAGLFSEQIDEEGLATRAEISTYVDDAMSGIMITADQVDINGIVQVAGSNSVTIGGFTVGSDYLQAGLSLSSGIMTLSATTLGFKQTGGIHVLIGPGALATAGDVGIYSNAPTGGFSMWGIGGCNLVSRYSSEMVLIGGLGLTYAYGSSFNYPANAPSGATGAWVDFLLMSYNTTLPAASTCPGKLLFVKCTSSYTLTVNKCITAQSATAGTKTWKNDDARAFFSDGTNWYELFLS